MLAFFAQATATFAKKLIITLVLEKNANFFAENWRKSLKIVIMIGRNLAIREKSQSTKITSKFHNEFVEQSTIFGCILTNIWVDCYVNKIWSNPEFFSRFFKYFHPKNGRKMAFFTQNTATLF
jgi:hypothetical protein